MTALLLAIGLSFLPTEPDTIMGITCPDYPGCLVDHRPTIIRIVPVDSQMVRVPVWWVKDVVRRIEDLENPPKPILKYRTVLDSGEVKRGGVEHPHDPRYDPLFQCSKCGGQLEYVQEWCDYSRTHPGESCAVLHGRWVCPKCGGPR